MSIIIQSHANIANVLPCHARTWLSASVCVYTLKTEVLKITLEASFSTLPKSARRDNTRSVTQTPREVSRS